MCKHFEFQYALKAGALQWEFRCFLTQTKIATVCLCPLLMPKSTTFVFHLSSLVVPGVSNFEKFKTAFAFFFVSVVRS